MLVVSVSLTVAAWMGVLTPWSLLGLHLPHRLRHRAQQPGLAGLGRRHGAARRPAGGGGAEQRRLQPHPQRRPGDRRAHRRHRRRRRRLRRQRHELHRADRRALRLAAGHRPEHAPARAARAGDGGGAALRRHVAQHPQGGAARLPLRPDRGGGDGAPAAGGAPPGRRAGRSSMAGSSAPSGSAPSAAPSSAGGCATSLSSEWIARLAFAGFAVCAAVLALSPRSGRRRSACWWAAPAGCWRWRSSTPRCSSPPRAGWSGARSRSTRPRPSAAWRSAAGSGAASPRRTGRREALLWAAAAMVAAGAVGPAAAAAGARRARPRPA